MKLRFISPLILIILFTAFGLSCAGEVKMLPNKAKLIEIKRDFTQTISITFFIKGGIIKETEQNNGIGNMFTRTWIKSSPMLEELEFYGGGLSANVSSDFIESALNIPTEHLDKLLGLYEELLLNPKFDNTIFEREKKFQLDEIKAALDNPQRKSFINFYKTTYKGTKYALTTDGEPESIEPLTLADIEKYYKDSFHAANMTITVAGNYSDAQLEKIKNIFSKFDTGVEFKSECGDYSIKKDERVEEEDERIEQAKLFVAYDAPPALSEDYTALKILNEILGGGMSSRYFNVLRKDNGFAYSVGTFFSSRLCNSRFTGYIGLNYENVEKAIKLMEKINKDASENISDDEMEKAKNYILGKILIESQTNSRTAWYSCFFETLGLGYDFLDTYVEQIRKTDAEAVKNAAKKYLKSPKTIYILK